jgi:tryptophanyl-tRNA synthetase
MLTGDRPTGRLHIGHYVGSLRRRVELQNEGRFDEMFIMIADTQALTDNAGTIQKVRDNVIEVALDYLSAGIDPEKVTIFVQSRVPELFEFTCYFMDLVSMGRLERNPTIKSELAMRAFGESIPVGFLTYPISQASDILMFGATIVPAGEDQAPMVEQAQEIAHKFNNLYKPVFVEPKIMLPESDACRRLPGTDGKAKMSKSLGNCIYLSDDSKTVEKKVMSMFTDPGHLRVEDPGKIEGNTVFTYLDAFVQPDSFEKFLPEYRDLDELKDHYRRGGLGDVKVKKFLFAVLNEFLSPIREKRAYYEAHPEEVIAALRDGTEEARRAAAATLADVKRAMKIDYFESWADEYGVK